jgi:VanZ family protein
MFKLIFNKRIFKILFFITLAIVFILALVPNDHVTIEYIYADKLKHMSAFFMLSLLLNRASSTLKHRIRNMILLLLFGIFIEVVQLYFPHRESSVLDVIADFAGIVLFQVSYSIFKLIKFKLKK